MFFNLQEIKYQQDFQKSFFFKSFISIFKCNCLTCHARHTEYKSGNRLVYHLIHVYTFYTKLYLKWMRQIPHFHQVSSCTVLLDSITELTINVFSSVFQIIIEATKGSSFTGDTAIDYVELWPFACPQNKECTVNQVNNLTINRRRRKHDSFYIV